METAVVIPAFNEEARIDQTLFSLSVQTHISSAKPEIVVVDNGSTDATAEHLKAWGQSCGPYKLHVVTEPEKGTGAAADTGFRFAIDELGAKIIARVDADTVVMPGWMQAIERYFHRRPDTALLTGRVDFGFDGAPNYSTILLAPRLRTAARIYRTVHYRSLGMLYFAPGHNMATSAAAYSGVGGFVRSSIAEVSEDVVYSLAIAKQYGLGHMAYSREMRAFTSSRRLSALGLARTVKYYQSESSERREKFSGGNVDIR